MKTKQLLTLTLLIEDLMDKMDLLDNNKNNDYTMRKKDLLEIQKDLAEEIATEEYLKKYFTSSIDKK